LFQINQAPSLLIAHSRRFNPARLKTGGYLVTHLVVYLIA